MSERIQLRMPKALAVGPAIIASALRRGTKHFDGAGRELTTVEDILNELTADRTVMFEPLMPSRSLRRAWRRSHP